MDDRVQLEIAGGDDDEYLIGGGESVDGQPPKRWGTVDDDKIESIFDLVELAFEPRLAVIDGARQGNIGVGEQDV